MIRSTDVFVIGGGPAGLAAAIGARKKGFDVTVADGAEPPIDKACGEGLLPDTVRVMKHLGIEMCASAGFSFRGIRFVDSGVSAQANFPAGLALGVRRVALHQRLVEHARHAGVSLLWGAPVTNISPNAVSLNGKTVAARWIVGADGIRSRVRRWTGLEPSATPTLRYAYRRHYRVRPWSDYTEVHWGQNRQAYVTPVGEQDVCVVVTSSDSHVRSDLIRAEFPELAARLFSAVPTDTERGAVTLSQQFKPVCQGNVALIGDASGSVDAITGEGLSLSFRQAVALADALEAGDLGGYQSAHRRLSRHAAHMGRLLLLLGRRPALRRRVMRTFAAHPELFARLLAMHVGESTPAHLAATGTLLGWRLLTA